MDRLAAGLRSIAEAILMGEIGDEAALEAAKKRLSAQLGLASLPSNADILGQARAGERESLKMLIRKP
ncbi:MAG TPA: tRNA uridine(34) 5-carboxymethylaminomethyl modification radical SAM/GNAT enzyme Elp3, partial [Methanothrix soehngenii]|nr:tRNA uridine(34) 5-carboxymethylaminomethyl modification radical SAM/GNAT enzyme Elp3 [Methanothrix soehngenii]